VADQLVNADQVRVHLQRATAIWQPAVEGFDPYVDRLRRLADGARAQRKALLFAELADARWKPQPTDENFSLAEHLEAGKRPGPEAIWSEFDAASMRLGEAFSGDGGYTELASAFAGLAKVIDEVADTLEKLGADQEFSERQQTG
jgi:hypothetical protein